MLKMAGCGLTVAQGSGAGLQRGSGGLWETGGCSSHLYLQSERQLLHASLGASCPPCHGSGPWADPAWHCIPPLLGARGAASVLPSVCTKAQLDIYFSLSLSLSYFPSSCFRLCADTQTSSYKRSSGSQPTPFVKWFCEAMRKAIFV